jgi:Protein of unknown function (DUF3828)
MDGITMIARRGVLVAVCACIALAAVRAGAADASAKSFVEAIYAAYTGKNSNGVSLDSDAAVRRYFAPKLAALIIKDRREARGEVGKLGSDPFIDAQDWEIDSVDVAVRETGSDKASATVLQKPGRAADRYPRSGQAQGWMAHRRDHVGSQRNFARPFDQVARGALTPP